MTKLQQSLEQKDPTSKSPTINNVIAERIKQTMQWGEQNHDPFFWFSILSEEVGEVAQDINDAKLKNDPSFLIKAQTELVQVAAVAVAFAESLSRNELKDIDD